MSISLNEVEATGKRAARGAGFDWGVAEEAGRAARWLCSNGLDGCAILANYLEGPRGHAPDGLQGVWRSSAGDLCPLIAGAALSDLALKLETEAIAMEGVAAPAILMPFAAWASLAIGENVSLKIGDAVACTDGARLSITGAIPPRASSVSVFPAGKIERALPQETRAFPSPESWEALSRLAHRTYAPATEESRRLGAGAGLSDND